MFFNTKYTAALCFATCVAFSSSAIADIVISGTRVIYKSDQKVSTFAWKIKAITHYLFRVGWILVMTMLSLAVLLSPLLRLRPYHALMQNAAKPSN